jgi:hypothetical protein
MIFDDFHEGNPGEICRKQWRLGSVLGSDPVGYLRNAIQKAKADLANQNDNDLVEYHRSKIFKYGMGLLAYGSLEGLEDVLNHATCPQVLYEKNGGGKYFMWFLPCLLPLPQVLRGEEVWGKDATEPMRDAYDIWIESNREKIRQWYRENKDRLVWDAEQDRYVLKDK